METEIVIAILALIGTASGTIYGVWKSNRLVVYKIDQLEKKVEKHNNLVERMAVAERDLKTAFVRIGELKEEKRYD